MKESSDRRFPTAEEGRAQDELEKEESQRLTYEDLTPGKARCPSTSDAKAKNRPWDYSQLFNELWLC